MLRYSRFLLEAKKIKEIKTGSPADSEGKVFEILLGKHLNGGVHAANYRAAGKTPEEIHNAHATALYGKNFQEHPGYQHLNNAAKTAAKAVVKHVGFTPTRTAWTSQPKDHTLETGVKDPLSKADLIITGKDASGRSKKVVLKALSAKRGKLKTINYANPGTQTMSVHSGSNLHATTQEHDTFLKSIDNKPENREEHKIHPRRTEIEASSSRSSQKMAGSYARGLKRKVTQSGNSQDQDEFLKAHVRKTVGMNGHVHGGSEAEGKTHLPHIIVKSKVKKDGTAETHVMDAEEHINNYLDHFHSLTVSHTPLTASVTIHGIHKKTGKKMPVQKLSIYSGGRQHTLSQRGSTTLPSETHKDVDTTKKPKFK